MYVKKFRCRKIPIVFLNCSFFQKFSWDEIGKNQVTLTVFFQPSDVRKDFKTFPRFQVKKVAELNNKCLVYLSQS